MNFKSLKIGNLEAKLPIIQGGMGIGVSLSKLASSVASCGGIGVISAAQIGFKEPDFNLDPLAANLRALKSHIKEAIAKAKGGIIGVNIMCAANNYKELVKTSIESGAHIIISGAGLPTDLPQLCEGSDVKLIPIVSSAKASSLILKMWDKRYNRIPDAVIFEGPDAGGHLGFKAEELDNSKKNIKNIILEVKDSLKEYIEKYNKDIPLIVAGGIFTGYDIAEMLSLGASGVQMATRFITTYECDAHENYKNAFLNCAEEDITIVKSPVGMPGRAISNKFVAKTNEGPLKVTKCFKCLGKCNPTTTPYCITEALINAVNGDLDNGLIFCGSNAYRTDKLVHVKDLMDDLKTELLNATIIM